MLIGYARVSTSEQETALQMDALAKAGVVMVYSEKASSVGGRPQLQEALAAVKEGDVLVVWKLDRIARSLYDLLAILDGLTKKKVGLRSLTEPIDTSSPIGLFMVQVLGAVAQLERSMIRERAIAGQVAALQRGVTWGGSVSRLSDEDRAAIVACWNSGWWTQGLIAEFLGLSRSTVKRVLGRMPNTPSRGTMPVLSAFLCVEEAELKTEPMRNPAGTQVVFAQLRPPGH